MFDWLGFKTGFPLWMSWQLNKDLKVDVEQTFEGFADTRKELLMSWASNQWLLIERLGKRIQEDMPLSVEGKQDAECLDRITDLMNMTYSRAADVTELFFIDTSGTVLASTFVSHIGTTYSKGSPLAPGLQYISSESAQHCLYGPYSDPMTLTIGPRSSSFHDAMTLTFMYSITVQNKSAGILCGRIPNDVIGDLIQRESGHIYPDSGDNYVFMAKPGLDRGIKPGTALSRSRFEDRTFTHGENLKDGVTTEWGIVSVNEHTELELLFTDPATGELHPGVAKTIANGSNLDVEFPGYSDYRHIPVIGKGVTFQLPHCPDKWGMMCEGDLEEVYRLRSIGWRQRKLNLLQIWLPAVAVILFVGFAGDRLSPWQLGGAGGLLVLLIGLAGAGPFKRKEDTRLVRHIRSLTRFIRMNAEGKGDLTQRLPLQHFDNDELKDIAKWMNNMMDSLEGIMLQVKLATSDVSASQVALAESAANTVGSTGEVNRRITDMIGSIRLQLQDIETAKEAADAMRHTLLGLEEQAAAQIGVAQSEVDRIGDKMHQISQKVGETNATVHTFMETVQQIQSVLGVIQQISAQTNLLALNASIEAARVGEQGKGFAVVANEIRKLANSTKESTEEVHAITENIYTEAQKAFASMEEGTRVVEEGSQLVAAAMNTLAEAGSADQRKSEAVNEVVGLLENIALVSRENREVSAGVEGKVTELTAEMSNVQQTSQSVESVTRQLQRLVGQFQLTKNRFR
ncbi:methyl-accepting chemotaxis protein [Paenibacillus sp. CAU 1782]